MINSSSTAILSHRTLPPLNIIHHPLIDRLLELLEAGSIPIPQVTANATLLQPPTPILRGTYVHHARTHLEFKSFYVFI